MARSTNTQERRLAELKREVAKLAFDHYRFILKNISELPCELQSSSITALVKSESVQILICFHFRSNVVGIMSRSRRYYFYVDDYAGGAWRYCRIDIELANPYRK
jgi:hypothetical protein